MPRLYTPLLIKVNALQQENSTYETTLFTDTVIKGSNGEERQISANVELDHIHPAHKEHRVVFRLRNWTRQLTTCPSPAGLLVTS
jgi:hypothetical protein